jgi:hypothetical protein
MHERENERVADNPRTFAERCEQVTVHALAPFTANAGRIMHRLEQWLDNRSPIGSSASSRESDPARGEQFVSDLAQGMLTKELIANAFPDSAGPVNILDATPDPPPVG